MSESTKNIKEIAFFLNNFFYYLVKNYEFFQKMFPESILKLFSIFFFFILKGKSRLKFRFGEWNLDLSAIQLAVMFDRNGLQCIFQSLESNQTHVPELILEDEPTIFLIKIKVNFYFFTSHHQSRKHPWKIPEWFLPCKNSSQDSTNEALDSVGWYWGFSRFWTDYGHSHKSKDLLALCACWCFSVWFPYN